MKNLILSIVIMLNISFVSSAYAETCTKIGETCVSGPETRTIGENYVYRNCWKYQDIYSCENESATDYCKVIASTPGCEQVSSKWLDLAHPAMVQFQNEHIEISR